MSTLHTNTHRIYTNDVERERLRQAAYAEVDSRLSLNRHRTRRSSARNLTIVARERKDRTLYDEVRQMLDLPAGTKLDDTYDLVKSRCTSRSNRYGFASNRMIRFELLPERVVPAFPLSEPVAARAVDIHGSLV